MAQTRIDDGQYKPAGSNTQLQYNGAGSVAASPNLTWDNGTNVLSIAGTIVTPAIQITTSPVSGWVLTSDASGNGTWQASSGSFDVNTILTSLAGEVLVSSNGNVLVA